MVSVLLLHIIVAVLAISFAYLGVKTNSKYGHKMKINGGYVVSFVVLLLFLGFRVSLGRDWVNYEGIFSSIFQQSFKFGETRELGFLALVGGLRLFTDEFQSFVFVSSFLMFFLFFIAYKRYYYLLPFGIFIFFVDWAYPVVINTIRQGIAIMAFLNATTFIDNKYDKHSGWKFLLFIAIGVLFHYSILIFLPFYYIGRLKLDIKWFILMLTLIIVACGFVVLPMYENTINLVDKYQSYANDEDIVNDESTFGLGAILVLLIRIAPLTVYSYVRKKHPELLKFFVLYFIGLSIYYVFYKYLLITRVTFYLQFLELFVVSYFLYFLFKEKKKYILYGLGYISLIMFNYIYTFKDFLIDQAANNNFSILFMDFTVRGL